MADQNINTNITATANFSSLTAQLKAVTSEMIKLQATTIGLNKNLTSQVGVINRQFDETMRSAGQFSRHFVTLTSDVSKFGQNLDSGRMKLNDYFRTWQGHTQKTSSLVKDLAKQQVMLENAIIQPIGKNAQGLMQYNVMVQQGLDVTKNKTALMRQEMSIMNKVMQDGANQLINWGKNTQWAGRQLTVGLTVPLAAFGMAAAKAFQQADVELTRLTKVYGGLTATSSSDLLKVRKDVAALSKELSSSMGANFTETIALAADIAATGKEGKDLLDSTRQSTRLAVLGEVDRQSAMKATLSIQTAFGQNTDELAKSIDFLNAVENQTSTSLQDLTDAIPKAGPVVKALGGDVKDLALYLTAMKEGGIGASEGANAIKSALASIINPTKVAKDMFNGFGIDLGGIVTKNAGNLTGTIMALKDSLDTLDPLNRSKAIEQLFGKFQFARMNALFENLGKSGSQTLKVLDLMKASTSELSQISQRELAQMTESASGKYKRALESVKADLATIGEQFLKVGSFVLNAIDKIVKFIGNLPGPIKAVLGFIGGLTAIAGPIIMLTGVLGNFFGYIVKGIFALKNIGKGGTGFKLLTPELMAAAEAGKSVEQSFYSDTKAAATFSDAVLTLASSFAKLKENAMSSTIATANSMSTTAGNPVLSNGARVVDKNNPLVGKSYSRDMSHMIPTGSKTAEQKANETIFSTVPGPKPVNQRISNAPQMYMNSDMPKIPGVTSVNGISTGVIASEAAKWHSMTAAIAMQSQEELTILKQEINATGTITSSLSESYQALLPKMTSITALAADEAGLIVQELQAGKTTVDAARAKIFELNAKVEAMMAQTAQGIATAQSRNLNLTTVPFTSQPVVSASGKSNMKELFHKADTSKTIDIIAKNLGVRTSGAGYSIQTTIPRRLNSGGYVYNPNKDGAVVPGDTSINYDNTMAKVPLGGFVLNQEASKNNPELVATAKRGYNSGGMVDAILTPGETVVSPQIYAENKMAYDVANKTKKPISFKSNGGIVGGMVIRNRNSYGLPDPSLSINSAVGLEGLLIRNSNPAYIDDLKQRMILHDAAVLENIGFSTEEALSMAKRDVYAAFDASTAKNGTVSRRKFNAIRIEQSRAMQRYIGMQGLRQTTLPNGTTAMVSYKDLIIPDTEAMLAGKRPQVAGIKPSKELLKAFGERQDLNQIASKRIIDSLNDKRDVYASEHTDPWSKWKTTENGITSTNTTRGNAYRAIAGSNNINRFTNWLSAMTGGKFKDQIALDQKSANNLANTLSAELGYGTSENLIKRMPSIKASIMTRSRMPLSKMLRMLLTRGRSVPFSKVIAANSGGQIGGNITSSKHNYGIMNSNAFIAKNPQLFSKTAAELTAKKFALRADENGQVWHTPEELRIIRERQINLGKYPKPKSYYQDLANQDPLHGALQIGRYQGAMGIRNQYVGPKIRYTGIKGQNRMLGTTSQAFQTGDIEARAKQALYRYMMGDYSMINDPAVQMYLTSLRTKQTGIFHRGIKPGMSGLPESVDKAIKVAAATGNWDSLIGKEFIMRRASWSSNRDTAEGFGSVLMTANVKNRNAVAASDIFPDLKFDSPAGPVAVNESEYYMGGKFKIVSAKDGKIKLKAIVDGQRANGGSVFAGQSYLVGEKGPELFSPQTSGKIIPHYELGGQIKASKHAYGRSGNPAVRAAQEAARAARAASYAPAPISQPEYKDGPLSGSKTTIIGNGGARTNVYGLQGSFPYQPALKLPQFSTINAGLDALKSASLKMVAGIQNAVSSTKEAFIKGGQLIKSKSDMFKIEMSKVGTVASNSLKILGEKIKMGASTLNGWINPKVIASRPPGAYAGATLGQNFAANARYSTGAMFHPLKFARAFTGQKLAINPANFTGQSMGVQMGAGMAGMAAGTAIGEKLGGQNGAMIGSMVGMTAAPMIATKAATAFAGLSTAMGGAGFGATAAAAAGLVAPLAAVAAAVYVGVKAWQHYKEGQRLNQVTFGLTAEAAKKAGLRFTDFGAKIKQTIQDAKDMAAANQLVYESMQDGGTPFKLTIEEYKKLKKEVKATFSDQIAALDRQPSNKVPDAVRRIKEQLVAAGMSAEEATKKVYTMLKLSNKSDQSITATMGNAKFRNITDAQSAAVYAVSDFGKTSKNEGNKEGALSFNTALMATETGINDLIAKRERLKAKDLTGTVKSLSYAEAEDLMLNRINKTAEARTKITQGTIDELAKENPEVKKILNSSDTLVSAWQKIRLTAQGFKGDLSALSSEQTAVVAKLFNGVAKSVAATNRAGMLKEQYANLEKLNKQIAAYTTALKGQTVAQQISDRDRLASLNKQIEANNKLADARKKALDIAQADNDLGRQIEKTRLEIANAMSTGDSSKAQSLRLDLESLTSQQQTEAQKNAIDKANENANKPLQAAANAITNKQQTVSDKQALAGESIDKVTAARDKQLAAIDAVNQAMTALYANAALKNLSLEDYVKTKEGKGEAAALVKAQETATGKKNEAKGPDGKAKDVGLKALDIIKTSGTKAGADSAIAISALGGGATLMDIVKALGGNVNKPTKNGVTFGADTKTVKGKTLAEAKKEVMSGKQTKMFTSEAGVTYDIFEWNGKNYAMEKTSGIVYPFDLVKQTVGKKAVTGAATGVMGGKGSYLVGERGPELIHLDSPANIMPNNILNKLAAASPKYKIPEAAYNMKNANVSHGGSFTLNQTIYAADGMDTEALATMIIKKAEVVIGQKSKINVKMVGQGKNI